MKTKIINHDGQSIELTSSIYEQLAKHHSDPEIAKAILRFGPSPSMLISESMLEMMKQNQLSDYPRSHPSFWKLHFYAKGSGYISFYGRWPGVWKKNLANGNNPAQWVDEKGNPPAPGKAEPFNDGEPEQLL